MSRFGTRGWVGALALAVVAGLLPAGAAGTATAADGQGVKLPRLKQPPTVAVKQMAPGGTKWRGDRAKWKAPKVTWPAPGTATVDVRASGAASAPKRAGALPVALRATASKTRVAAHSPGKVKVTVASRDVARKAGVDGILLSLSPTDAASARGEAQVQVDYKSFRGAYGGDWAARLRLVQMPACVLTTPAKPVCRIGKPLATRNDTKTGTLSAAVTLPGSGSKAARTAPAPMGAAVLAATADDSGPTGNYKATSLQPSGSWSHGGSTGAFSWSYPIGVPSVPGGLQPKISLGYNSQSVDGRTAASNNQPSWVGDGWDWEPGYIERRYKPCNDDKTGGTNTTKVGDLCWYNNNAILSLGGKNTELVYDSTKGWHPASDSGEKVEKLTGASNPDKGTAGVDGVGEHWKITTTDGTQYFFGLNKLPGWSDNGTAADDPVTNSTWTVPVFGNQSGEPCYNSSFAAAWCQQAWRWQLDYVVDPRGNAEAYYWKTEANNYGRNVSETTGASTLTPYIRGGYLDHIDYGLRSNSVYSAKAMAQVWFGVSERCLTTCGTFDATNAKNWPDVPFDQYCKDGSTECKDQYSPTFWSRKRLTGITTKVLTGGVHKDVDAWVLKQGFPPSGDGVSTPMWLESITRTGKAGGTAGLPAVTFTGVQKPNRVDSLGDGLAPFVRLRMSQITTETGGSIGIDYLDPECTAPSLPPTDASNSTRCYPVKWAYEGETAKQDWFNSYVVQRVIEGDNLAATPDTVIEYAYVGGAEWSKSTDEFTKPEDRTYSVARGYYQVQTRKGAGTEPKTFSEARYFRGIDGAAVENSANVAVTDREQFAGWLRESATYNGNGGALVSATSYTPWRSAKTAARSRTAAELPDLEAYYTGTAAEETRTTVTGGGTRTTKVTRGFDSYGMVSEVSEHGDITKSGDEKCTTTQYARNTNAAVWILNTVSRTETVAAACGTTVSRPGDIIDDIRAYYDGGALGAAPTKALVTKTDRINGSGNGYDVTTSVPRTCGLTQDQYCFDQYGRSLATADAYGKVTSTAFTPASGEVATTAVVINPLGHKTTTVVDPLRGQPVKVTDANSKVTSTAYDALGRVTKVWTPTRSAVTYPSAPNYSFDYLVRKDGPVVVTTRVLDHNSEYQTSYAFYDGLLRPRQTQAKAPDNAGRLLTEVFYNTRGEAWLDSGTYFATGAPEAVLVTGQETQYPASTETIFDGVGRPTAVITKRFGDETKRTTSSYAGDVTTITPPEGGTTTTTVVDALGRTTQVRQHTGAEPPTQSISYTYNKHGRLETVTDPSGAKWTYTYDVRGRQTRTDDPDKGATVTTYDHGDRVTDAQSVARGITLHTDYDPLGRPTALKKGTTTLSAWTYDTVAKGQLTAATRYIDGNAYINEITEYGDLYQPAATKFIVPASEGPLAGTYEWFNFFTDNTGQLTETEHPEMGGLPAESVTSAYNTAGLLDSVYAGSDPIISSSTYDHYGRNVRAEYGEFGRHLFVTNEFDDHTSNLTRTYTDREVAPQRVEDTRYTYDPAGNITQIATAYGQDATRTTDTQCFTLDALRRITEAWTNTGEECAETPSAAVVGGQDAYWTTYTYDAIGNRKAETQHKTASGPTADTIRTYADPEAGKHNLPKVTQTGTDPHDETYTYDGAGNTTMRKIGTNAAQTLDWDDEGHLKSVTQGTNVSSYLYDVEGQRLIRKDSTGTTLYLPGGNELHMDKVGLVTGTRYYGSIAMRTGGKLTFTLTDHHNTTTTQITADATQAITRRKTTIFGAPRGTQPTAWTGDKTFVGGTKDKDTGLTHLGAREYDPMIGRFISVDPIMVLTESQQIHPYTYSANNPVIFSDPSGLALACGRGGDECPDDGDPMPEGPNDDGNGLNHGDTPGSDGPAPGSNGSGGLGEEIGYDFNEDGYISFWPGVDVPASWDKARVYIQAFYDKIDLLCHYGPEVCGDPEYPLFSHVTNSAKGGGCLAAVGKDCGGDLAHLGWSAMVQASGAFMAGTVASEGPAGGPVGWRWGKQGNCTKCFLAGTDVLMANGTTKDIEKIEVGDEVLAANPLTGEAGKREVTDLIVTEDDKHFNELTISTPDGSKKLTATHEHPFWSPSEKQWIEASKLKPGMTLRTDRGATVTIEGNRPYTKHARTYNLTVDGLHTYYVLAGEIPVLVHNAKCGPGTLPGTRFDVPTEPGVYTIHLNDGTKYVGSSTTSIRERVNKSMRSKHAVRKAGYTADDVVNVTYFTLPHGTDGVAIRRMEQTMMEGVKERGWTLLNRRDPEIQVPFGGYLP
ncbi:polymorphic toxin-type HINT domain-containing protein [Streptomyces wuyuanensis]|uniref:polymorphic toxin-type HINT domain-containing protein n=1 Tax=Streptomyces wuyuanensis TaxID=1196353 RepID=UPI000B8684E6|nr:polymorphic toxin-type HINT domain-containing protein [Streptomyces wuyuanensis]